MLGGKDATVKLTYVVRNNIVTNWDFSFPSRNWNYTNKNQLNPIFFLEVVFVIVYIN